MIRRRNTPSDRVELLCLFLAQGGTAQNTPQVKMDTSHTMHVTLVIWGETRKGTLSFLFYSACSLALQLVLRCLVTTVLYNYLSLGDCLCFQ